MSGTISVQIRYVFLCFHLSITRKINLGCLMQFSYFVFFVRFVLLYFLLRRFDTHSREYYVLGQSSQSSYPHRCGVYQHLSGTNMVFVCLFALAYNSVIVTTTQSLLLYGQASRAISIG